MITASRMWGHVDDFLHDVGVLPHIFVVHTPDAEFDVLIKNVRDNTIRIQRLEDRIDALAEHDR